jgi:glycosyltransferase involved in cell wall biosynthesis
VNFPKLLRPLLPKILIGPTHLSTTCRTGELDYTSQPEFADTPWPRISIVIPSKNHGQFLSHALDSLISQGYPNLEILISDCCSTDRTLDVIRKYEKHVTWWRSEPDDGQAQAINKAFEVATGDILGWLNSDDVLLPGALHSIASTFCSDSTVDVVYGQRILMDEDGKPFRSWWIPYHSRKVLNLVDPIPQETMYWRRHIWEATGGKLNQDFQFAMDWDFLDRLSEAKARFYLINRYLGGFRVHASQKTQRLKAEGQKEMALIRDRCANRNSYFPVSLIALLAFALTAKLYEVCLPLRRHHSAIFKHKQCSDK